MENSRQKSGLYSRVHVMTSISRMYPEVGPTCVEEKKDSLPAAIRAAMITLQNMFNPISSGSQSMYLLIRPNTN